MSWYIFCIALALAYTMICKFSTQPIPHIELSVRVHGNSAMESHWYIELQQGCFEPGIA